MKNLLLALLLVCCSSLKAQEFSITGLESMTVSLSGSNQEVGKFIIYFELAPIYGIDYWVEQTAFRRSNDPEPRGGVSYDIQDLHGETVIWGTVLYSSLTVVGAPIYNNFAQARDGEIATFRLEVGYIPAESEVYSLAMRSVNLAFEPVEATWSYRVGNEAVTDTTYITAIPEPSIPLTMFGSIGCLVCFCRRRS